MGAGHDLGRRGGEPVGQHDQRLRHVGARLLGEVGLVGAARAPARLHHLGALGQEDLGHVHGLGQEPARVAAQVEHQALGPVPLDAGDRPAQLRAAGLREGGQAHVAHAAGEGHGVGHVLHPDDPARDRVVAGLALALAPDLHLDVRPGRPAQLAHHVLDGQPARALAVISTITSPDRMPRP